jgi:hypothetical protein
MQLRQREGTRYYIMHHTRESAPSSTSAKALHEHSQRKVSILLRRRVPHRSCDCVVTARCNDGSLPSRETRKMIQRSGSVFCNLGVICMSTHCSDYDWNSARVDNSLPTNEKKRNIAQRAASEVCNTNNTRVHAHGGDNGGGCTRVDYGLLTSGEVCNIGQRPASVMRRDH